MLSLLSDTFALNILHLYAFLCLLTSCVLHYVLIVLIFSGFVDIIVFVSITDVQTMNNINSHLVSHQGLCPTNLVRWGAGGKKKAPLNLRGQGSTPLIS